MQTAEAGSEVPQSAMNFDVRNVALLNALNAAGKDPASQIGVLMMAQIVALRGFLKEKKITDRGRRSKIIKAFMVDVERKLRQFVADPNIILHEERQAEAMRMMEEEQGKSVVAVESVTADEPKTHTLKLNAKD